MKRLSFLIYHFSFSVALLLAITAQAQTHDWENPHVLGINKLPYHATLQLPSKQKSVERFSLLTDVGSSTGLRTLSRAQQTSIARTMT